MKKLTTILACTLMLAGCIGAGVNSDLDKNGKNFFPTVTGIDLFGQDRVLPETFEGQLNMVAVAFKQEQQEQVNTWIAVAEKLMKENDNLRFYEVPVIFKANPLFRTWVNNGMRSGIPSDTARERTITIYTDREEFSDLLDMDMNDIYLLITDNKGRILWREKGSTDERKIEKLSNFIQKYEPE